MSANHHFIAASGYDEALLRLIDLAERAGLAEDLAYQLLAPGARELGAVGVAVSSEGDGVSTRARVVLRADG